MVMRKDAYELPIATYEVTSSTWPRTFNISGEFYEYKIYVMPDTYKSGSFAVSAGIEELYVYVP